jgi:predicted P-loop ATPase
MEHFNSEPTSSSDVTPAQSSALSPVGDTDAAIAFLRAMHPSGPWVLTVLDPERVELSITETFQTDAEGALRSFIEKWNGKRGLYFSTNPLRTEMRKKAKATDVAALTYLHVDIDPRKWSAEVLVDKAAYLDEERVRILSLLREGRPAGIPKPTAIVFSGGGYQAFWKLVEPLPLDGSQEAAEQAKLWNLGLERQFGSADSCHNIDRIMRLPGTINLPTEKKRDSGRVPTPAALVEADWSLAYSLSDFDPASPTPTAPRAANENTAKGVTVDVSGPLVQFVDVHDLDKHTADGKPLEDRIKRIIQDGYDELDDRPNSKPRGDRSRWVLHATCALVRRGVADNAILSVLLDRGFRISDHIYDQKVGAEKYAVRQVKRAKEKVALTEGQFKCNDEGKPYARSQHNIKVALAKLGIDLKLDTFRNRMLAEGIEDEDVYVDDAIVRRLWLETDQRFGFLPPRDFYFDVIADTARVNSFHPVRDYLDSPTWDRQPRLSTWLSTYAGAKDSAFVQAISRIVLIAAVRRVRQPGCKFDQMLILEGDQGAGKSTLVKALAVRDEWFADEAPLGGDGKLAIEMLSGKWLVEPAELKSLKNSEVEHVKAFLSRQADRGREAYGRIVSEVPRQCIFIGTTNSDRYLMDPTGNRRFWSVKVGRIDVEGLNRDLDQLWAEAAYWEATDESIQLPDELWGVAAAEQAQRVVDDPYLSTLAQKLGAMKGKIVKNDVYRLLELPVGHRHTGHERRVGETMRALGWRSTKLRRDGKPPIACFINCDEADAIWIDVRTAEGGGETWAELSAEDPPWLRIV